MLKSIIRSLVPEAVYDRFRRAKQQRMTSRFTPYDVEHSYGGRRFKMHIADPVGAEWYDHDEEKTPEIEFLERYDLTGATVFDLGAHQCLVAMLLAELTGKQGRVIAVEANEHNQQVAMRNLALNGALNVTCLHALISSGKMAMSIDGGLNGRARRASGSVPQVAMLTIDQMRERFGQPALVFLDIEGHEIEALAGATETLLNGRTHWFIELHGDEDLSTYGHRNSDIFKTFKPEAFNAYLLDTEHGTWAPLQPENLPHDRCHVFFERH